MRRPRLAVTGKSAASGDLVPAPRLTRARPTTFAAALLVVLVSFSARAEAPPAPPGRPPRPALFALIVGVNASLDADVAPLSYADDDAARYQDLFRALGARTYLLSSLDANTRHLHPQAAAEAQPARRQDLQRAVVAIAHDIGQARARGIRTILYVIYAGHGDARVGSWRLTLEDGHLDGAGLLDEVVNPAGADQVHVIVDACQAYLLAFERGPGGTRRPVSGFVELEAASRQGRVGYLLSTSITGETHEWAGFEAGVFSHELRSGLYGAADADGDGVVTYSEIAAFVTRANAPIASERFRPRIVARAPRGDVALLDVRGLGARELRFAGPQAAGHYLLEDEQGVRLLDFHGSGTVPLHLVRPPGTTPMYLRRVSDGAERVIPPSDGSIELETLTAEPPRAGVRGAAHQAFSAIFSLPFDPSVVAAYDRDAAAESLRVRTATSSAPPPAPSSGHSRTVELAGWSATGLGVAALSVAGALELSALAIRSDAGGDSQAQAVARNDRIATRNRAATVLVAGGGAALAAGIALVLWQKSLPVVIAPDATGLNVSTTWRF